jgi:hypothetical protein
VTWSFMSRTFAGDFIIGGLRSSQLAIFAISARDFLLRTIYMSSAPR